MTLNEAFMVFDKTNLTNNFPVQQFITGNQLFFPVSNHPKRTVKFIQNIEIHSEIEE